MKRTHDDILKDTLYLLRQLADDWEYSGTIDRSTYFLAELGFESLDVVILSEQVSVQYNQALPFIEFFEEIGKREVKDVTVGEWVDFIHDHLDEVPESSPWEQG
jgi:hypothetical protein